MIRPDFVGKEPQSTNVELLITGTGSGLGKHLLETLGGKPWDRGGAGSAEAARGVIIHSAWPARAPETSDGLAAYVQSTLELTRQAVERPHEKFIFISTAEVYPLTGHSGAEDQPIVLSAVRNLYAHCKLMAEAIVRERGRNVLILRSTGLLGPTARTNSLMRVLSEEGSTLTLSAESRFYYILHRDVSAFIRLAVERNLGGIYNLCSSQSITLGEVARRFGRTVNWGGFTYDVGRVDNRKIAAVSPAFKKTSLEVIEEFVSSWRPAPTKP
jgi:nucleoside-diphosphate-sugar epimerase